MTKCPACGYDNSKKYNPSNSILSLLRQRGLICSDLLKKASKKIFYNVQTDNNLYKYFLFLQSISNIPDRVINRMILTYLFKKPYLKGKGFAYLRVMITNTHSNSKKLLANEYKSIGKPTTIVNNKQKGDTNE